MFSGTENRAFWEAYCSNFIEGTKFTVEEAQELVKETGDAINLELKRPEDAHDVKETYRLIIDPNISGAVAKNQDDYMNLIIRRHARMMATRHDVEPGVFKSQNNEVGSRTFVKPELVRETLARGWSASRELKSAAARAFYMLFVVAEKFEKSRIVFWNDVKCELRNDFEALELTGIEKIELKSNEFAVKYRILREAPEDAGSWGTACLRRP